MSWPKEIASTKLKEHNEASHSMVKTTARGHGLELWGNSLLKYLDLPHDKASSQSFPRIVVKTGREVIREGKTLEAELRELLPWLHEPHHEFWSTLLVMVVVMNMRQCAPSMEKSCPLA